MAKNDDNPVAIDTAQPVPETGDVRGFMQELVAVFRGDLEAARKNERDAMRKLLDSHDSKRAAAPKVKLACVAPFMMVDDDNPEGREIKRGEVFEVSEFDLQRYLGRGLPVANEPQDKSGVTISQA